MANIVSFHAAQLKRAARIAAESSRKSAAEHQESAEDAELFAKIAAFVSGVTEAEEDREEARKAEEAAQRERKNAAYHIRCAQKLEEEAEAIEVTPEELADILSYQETLQQPTQNAEGVHVGDLFVYTFGYDMILNHFYQVVGMKGKHTVILRRIGCRSYGDYAGYGKESAKRNAFIEETTIERKTSMRYNKVHIRGEYKNDSMCLTNDFEMHDFDTWD